MGMWPILLHPLQVPNSVDVGKVFTKSYGMISPLGRVVNVKKGLLSSKIEQMIPPGYLSFSF